MLAAYFDESESFDPVPRVYTVAGYISTVERWQEFSTEWQTFLDNESLPPFSMKRYANVHDKTYGKMTDGKRKSVIRVLHKILKKHYLLSFSTSVSLQAFAALSAPQRLALGTPHSFTAIDCLKQIHTATENLGLKDPMAYIYEQGSKHERHFEWLLLDSPPEDREFYRIGSVSFATKAVQPLQAADILAYETRKEMCRRITPNNKRTIRKSLINLEDPKRDYWFFLGEKELADLFEEGTYLANMTSDPEFIERANEAQIKGVI